MNNLTINELKEKIEHVKKDLESLRTTGESGRKLEILNEYKTYLEEELVFLKREQKS